jgi:hypothetical protein
MNGIDAHGGRRQFSKLNFNERLQIVMKKTVNIMKLVKLIMMQGMKKVQVKLLSAVLCVVEAEVVVVEMGWQ